MPQHEKKKCPRCSNTFECKVGNVAECQCSQIQLTYEERSYISSKHMDCLCFDCLQALRYEHQKEDSK